jgi:4-hydroxybenzoate polyprenyltransferase
MIQKILRFTKIEHTAFSLPLLFAGAFIGADGNFPSVSLLFLIIIAAVGARIFGMALNRIFDRKIDAQNPRTASRELPNRVMSVKAALTIAFTGLGVYVAACIILNGWCLILSWVPLIPLAGYSLLKRFTPLCHFGIGLCLAIAPIGAFVAVTGHLRFTAELFLFAFFVFCWMSGADIIYALLDVESDRKNGIYSLPANQGAYRAQKTAAVVHTLAVICMVIILALTNGGICAWITAITGIIAFILMYIPMIPVMTRFFPISSLAGIAGAMVPILGNW